MSFFFFESEDWDISFLPKNQQNLFRRFFVCALSMTIQSHNSCVPQAAYAKA